MERTHTFKINYMTIKQLKEKIDEAEREEDFSEESIVKFWDGEQYKEVTGVEVNEYNGGEIHFT